MIGLCELVKMTPQNYYARRSARRRQAVDLELVLALVRAQRAQQSRAWLLELEWISVDRFW